MSPTSKNFSLALGLIPLPAAAAAVAADAEIRTSLTAAGKHTAALRLSVANLIEAVSDKKT